jgi:hypothetical protein
MDTQNLAGEPAPTTHEPENKSLESIKKINPKYAWTAVVIVLLAILAFQYKNLIVAATVDGHVINRLSVIKKLEKQSGEGVLNQLIEDQLIAGAATKNNITVSEQDINTKIDTIKVQIESTGGSLDAALDQAGMNMDDLRYEVSKQLKLEKLLIDKLNVSDEELNKYVADNKITIPADETAESTKNQIRDQLKSMKFSQEASKFLTDLRTSAKVRTFVEY